MWSRQAKREAETRDPQPTRESVIAFLREADFNFLNDPRQLDMRDQARFLVERAIADALVVILDRMDAS